MTLNKVLRWTGWSLISLGLIVLEFAVYEVVGTTLVTKGHQNALREEFHAIADDPVIDPAPAVSESPSPRPRPRNSRAIALLKIPSIDVDIIVVNGVKLSDLVYGPGRYPTSAELGEEGSTAIAGHRTGWGSPFINLDKVKVGDRITVESTDGDIYAYRVTGSTVVGPDDAWVLKGNPKSSSKHQLTLTTCTPKYTSRLRLILWADLIESKAST